MTFISHEEEMRRDLTEGENHVYLGEEESDMRPRFAALGLATDFMDKVTWRRSRARE